MFHTIGISVYQRRVPGCVADLSQSLRQNLDCDCVNDRAIIYSFPPVGDAAKVADRIPCIKEVSTDSQNGRMEGRSSTLLGDNFKSIDRKTFSPLASLECT